MEYNEGRISEYIIRVSILRLLVSRDARKHECGCTKGTSHDSSGLILKVVWQKWYS